MQTFSEMMSPAIAKTMMTEDGNAGDYWCPDQPTVQCETDLTLAALGLVPVLDVRFSLTLVLAGLGHR